jgi:colanic acid biosynthesis glycosyl transferase WcaI
MGSSVPHTVFFTQLYYPDMTTTATIMTDLLEDLASYGMTIEVVCAQPTYLKDLGIQEFRNSGIAGSVDLGKFPRIEWHRGVAIRRVWSFLFDKNKNIGRILNSTSCFSSMLPRLFSTSKNDLLVFNTNPALLSLLGFIGAKLRRQRYVVLVHDLWPELPAHIGMIKKGGALYRIIDFLSRLSFKYACGIVVLSEVMKQCILDKVPEMNRSVHVIHNWADASQVYPVAKKNNRLLKEIGLEQKKVVMYSGNLGRYQPLEVMIGAANELKERNDILFLFAGDGGKRQKIQQMAASLNLDNIKFIPFQPLDRLAESLSMADVALIGIYSKNEGVIMPSKLYSLLAVGRPIICVSDPKSEVAKILRYAKAGLDSSMDDPKELAQKIVALLDDQTKGQELGQNGRRYFLEHFERKKVTKQWKEVIEKVGSKE